MKRFAIGLFGCLLSSVLHAEAWEVTVTVNYVNSQIKAVVDVPVLTFMVPVGQCVKGKTRTERMIPKPIKVTQEICVQRDRDRTKIKGWIFATERITDLAMKGELGASDRGVLNYGQPLDIDTDGNYIQTRDGHYTITASRNHSF